MTQKFVAQQKVEYFCCLILKMAQNFASFVPKWHQNLHITAEMHQ
jgi:hypothetical protein